MQQKDDKQDPSSLQKPISAEHINITIHSGTCEIISSSPPDIKQHNEPESPGTNTNTGSNASSKNIELQLQTSTKHNNGDNTPTSPHFHHVPTNPINAFVSNITNYYDIANNSNPNNINTTNNTSTPASPTTPTTPYSARSASAFFSELPKAGSNTKTGSKDNKSGYRLLNKYTLEFDNKTLEAEFQEGNRARYAGQRRGAAIAITLIYLLHATMIGILQFSEVEFFVALLCNAALALLLYVCLCIRQIKRFTQHILFAYLIGKAFLQLYSAVVAPWAIDIYFALGAFYFFALFSVLRVGFKNGILIGIAYVIVHIIGVIIVNRNTVEWYFILSAPLYSIAVSFMGCAINYLLETKEREALVRHHIVELESQKMAWHSKRDRALLLSVFPQSFLGELERHHFRTRFLSPAMNQRSAIGFNQLAHFFHSYENVSVLVADIVGFTVLSSNMPAQEIVSLLNTIFEAFDELCCKFGLEKIRTIGDAYLCVGNMTTKLEKHQEKTLELGWQMIEYIHRMEDRGIQVNLRIGMNCGPVFAGVTGLSKWNYDIFGATLTGAALMEQTGCPGEIQITEAFYQAVQECTTFAYNEVQDEIDGSFTYFVSEKLSHTGSSRNFLSYIEANHHSLIFDANLLRPNETALLALSNCEEQKAPGNDITSSIQNSEYYRGIVCKLEAEMQQRSKRKMSDIDEEILGYDVIKEDFHEELALIGQSFFPKFKEPREHEFRTHSGPIRQAFINRVTLYMLIAFLIMDTIELFMVGNPRIALFWEIHIAVLVLTTSLWFYTRSRFYLMEYGDWIVGGFLLVIGGIMSTFSFYKQDPLIIHLRVQPMIFAVFAFFFYSVPPLFLVVISCLVYAIVLGTIPVYAIPSNWLSLISMFLITVMAFVILYRTLNKNFRKDFIMWNLIKNDILHKQRAINRSKLLLYNLFPKNLVEKLDSNSARMAEYFPDASIMFVNITGFSKMEQKYSPSEMLSFLNDIFVAFDTLSFACKLEKIKTIGSKYMVASGIPLANSDHAAAAVSQALKMFRRVKKMTYPGGEPVILQVGIASGPVVAGIIGKSKYSYDCWSDTVNTASRMESAGREGYIQVTEQVYNTLRDKYAFQRQEIHVKGKGCMTTYLLNPDHPLPIIST